MLDFLITHSPLFYLVQSLWRDEAFSVLIAEKSMSSFIGTLNFEPPLYYLFLHIWVRFFGTSEIAVRSLSFLGFTLATIVVIFWSEKLFKKHWLSWVTPILFFLNPMLLYYAFEVRAYGWLMFFSTLSLYAYSTQKYKLLFIANALAFYTHSYAIIIPFVQFVHFCFIHFNTQKTLALKKLIHSLYFKTTCLYGLIVTPWVFVILKEIVKSRPTWYYPVDLQLVLAVLGNMFVGYDGTPGGWWKHTSILSFILLGFFIFGLVQKKFRQDTSYLFLAILLPLFLVVGVSFHKPLFVNRYLIFVTIAQVMLLSYSMYQINKKYIQIGIAALLILFSIAVNIQFPTKKAKLDIRSTIQIANAMRGKNDVLYVSSPLIFFEAQYYTPDRENVYLYNPNQSAFPWYVGESAFNSQKMTSEYPEYPTRAIIVGEDNSITLAYRTYKSSVTNTTVINTPAINTQ